MRVKAIQALQQCTLLQAPKAHLTCSAPIVTANRAIASFPPPLSRCTLRLRQHTFPREQRLRFGTTSSTQDSDAPAVQPTTPVAPTLHGRLQRCHVQDGIMGILCRYTPTPIRDLELDSQLEELEAVVTPEEQLSSALPFGAEPPTNPTQDASSTGEDPENKLRVKYNRRMWDCLDTVEFALDVERFFGVRLSDAEADQVTTPQSLVDFVCHHLRESDRLEVDDDLKRNNSNSAEDVPNADSIVGAQLRDAPKTL